MHVIREPDGRIPVIGTNEAARIDAFARVQTYLGAETMRREPFYNGR